MPPRMRLRPGGGMAALLLLGCAALAAAAPKPAEEIIVTAARAPLPALEVLGNTTRLDAREIALTSHQHVYELAVRAPGAWLSRGSGQEHLTAIRSPVLTGPGACGAFLMLEDGIPMRPTGFCNVNQLFEVPTELASAAEILRGPANALYGSNGLHGTLNFVLPAPGSAPGWSGSVEAGPDGFLRGRATVAGAALGGPASAGFVADDYDGFQNDAGYSQQKGFARFDRQLPGGTLRLGFTATRLDQDTAGFIVGQDAYRDPVLRTINPNPEAFRKADSQRFYAAFAPDANTTAAGAEIRAFARRSDMEFLQHFLPGQPLEENGQVSGGLMITAWRERGRARLTTGLDAEYARGFLVETQFIDLGPDSDRPTGQHYDYVVDSLVAAPYAQLELALAPRWTLQAGLRLELLRYDYDNRMLAGDTRADGTPCPDGCLFFRPADRSDDFGELAPNLGLAWRFADTGRAWLTLTRGFRFPQATELYRLQSGQAVADLAPERLDGVELGVRLRPGRLRTELVIFAMRKENYIFRDADGFNVSDGETEHVGVEFQLGYRAANGLYADAAATFARHSYAFDRVAARRETITDGNDVDTAPRTLGSARLGIDRGPWLAELEWLHQGRYYLDAENTARYPGHDLLNLRVVRRFDTGWSVTLRLNNLTDRAYADRADFAFGNYRYFPGRERELFVQVARGVF